MSPGPAELVSLPLQYRSALDLKLVAIFLLKVEEDF